MGAITYLLDTHTFIWAVRDDHKLSNNARMAIKDATAQLYVSVVSAYEITNKYRIGKLPGYEHVAKNYFDFLHELGTIELPVNVRHAHFAGSFEWGHKDPFDRILAAQAYIDNLTLITNDTAFHSLPWITVLW